MSFLFPISLLLDHYRKVVAVFVFLKFALLFQFFVSLVVILPSNFSDSVGFKDLGGLQVVPPHLIELFIELIHRQNKLGVAQRASFGEYVVQLRFDPQYDIIDNAIEGLQPENNQLVVPGKQRFE